MVLIALLKNSSGSYSSEVRRCFIVIIGREPFQFYYIFRKLSWLFREHRTCNYVSRVFNVSTEATAVGYFSASDTDNDFLHFNIVEVSDYDRASIDKASGLITLNSPLGAGETINLLIEVSDGISKTSKGISIKGTSDINNFNIWS